VAQAIIAFDTSVGVAPSPPGRRQLKEEERRWVALT